jgi:altronate dehydratase
VKPALVISERDNVATALEVLEPGRQLVFGPLEVTIREVIPHGHKVAIVAIASGAPVIKYGSPIGLASAEIPAGAHVHTHNVASSRGRGDLGPTATGPEPRLAEPPDEDADTGEARSAARASKASEPGLPL